EAGHGVDGLRVLALEPHHDGTEGAVAGGGRREGAVQVDRDVRDAGADPGVVEHLSGEHRRGAHRPHGVGARRPDADLEHVERADAHHVPPRRPGPSSGGGLPAAPRRAACGPLLSERRSILSSSAPSARSTRRRARATATTAPARRRLPRPGASAAGAGRALTSAAPLPLGLLLPRGAPLLVRPTLLRLASVGTAGAGQVEL